MKELLLKTQDRPSEKGGTANSRRLRREGLIPGVVYGQGENPVSVLVNFKDLRSVMITDAGVNAIISLDLAGKRKMSIVKELQRHPITHDVLHVDFLLINQDEEVQVEIPIHLEGTAKKVEQEQGIVDQILFELTVLAKPDNIPTMLEFDISDLEVGDTITVANLALPAGSRTLVDLETTVASAELTRMALAEEIVEEDEEGEPTEEGEEATADGEDGEKDSSGQPSAKGASADTESDSS